MSCRFEKTARSQNHGGRESYRKKGEWKGVKKRGNKGRGGELVTEQEEEAEMPGKEDRSTVPYR